MPEQQTKKDQFRLNGGLNTEASEVSFPDGFTTDEANYDLELDGSRRRRKGLAAESGGSTKTLDGSDTLTVGELSDSFLWKNVGGDPDKRFWVHKLDSKLYFTDDDTTPSSAWHTDSIDLDNYKLGTPSSDTKLVDFTSGRGDLFVACEVCNTLRITYDASGDSFSVEEIFIQIRDFDTIQDQVPMNYSPAAAGAPSTIEDADLTADHYYNLRNRGWKDGDMVTYANDKSEWPAKSMAWHRGYRRQVDALYQDLDGVQVFNSDKMEAEATGLSSAPLGTLLLKVADDTVGFTESIASQGNLKLDIAPSIVSFAADPWVITFDETAHNWVATDQVEIAGYAITYNSTGGGTGSLVLGGTTVTVASTNANDWTFNVDQPSDYLSGGTHSFAYWYASRIADRSTGTGPLTVGPTAVEFHEGRLFYAGVPDSAWADYIFFSQVATSSHNYNRCHAENDPTDPNENQLLGNDGGYVIIPNVGNVKKLVSMRQSILVFSDEGVWELIRGRDGTFQPDNFQVRKITDAECTSAMSPIKVDNTAFYTGPKGVYLIRPNQFTSVLEAVNITEASIQTLWNKIGATYQPLVKTVYDDAKKRLLFMVGGSGLMRTWETAPATDTAARFYNVVLGLDLRLNAWFKYEFRSATAAGVLGAFAISGADDSDSAKKVKYLCQTAAGVVTICDMDQTAYLDFDGTESPLPYFYTGWDNIGDFQRRRQAPVITVYAKRTETGYTATGNGWDGDNESSNLLTAYWDWTDDSVSGKIGSENETYRHVRGFVPSGATDVDGYPVVVTRNKIRGRGRVLQLRFKGAATKDSHILGFTTNYKVSRGR
jgi:hypothetical protein